jgi:cytochrome c-type biogenesis protein CcmF
VTLQLVVNPLVNWIWVGFGIMALGTGIALLPERSFAFALAKMPAEAAATTVAILLMIVLGGGTSVSAQKGMGGDANTRTSFYARTPFEKEMQHEIVCTCGACGHQTLAECRKDPCPVSHEMRGQLAAMIDSGMNDRDKIIQAFIAKYGSEEMLGAPVDRGFSRLAWLFPYLVGATSAIAVGFAAVKWTRKPGAPASAAAPLDSALEERIDDELRDLD